MHLQDCSKLLLLIVIARFSSEEAALEPLSDVERCSFQKV